MRMIDCRCPECGDIYVDVLLRAKDDKGEYIYPSCRCGATVERVHLQGAEGGTHGIVTDQVPGGIYVKNALCHSDGTPRRFDSKSEMHKFAKKKGYMNLVQHQGGKGGDKSKHTQRFI